MAEFEITDSDRKAYRDRLKYLRKGQECFQVKEVSKAIQYYATYLKSLAGFFGASEFQLDPKFFSATKDKAELLLISQVYWDLAKSYDRSPGGIAECIRCLSQFVKFTTGFRHQHINAQLIKKYIRQKKAVNIGPFKDAAQKIAIESKGCFISSYCYGPNHPITEELRFIKLHSLNGSPMGIKFITFYYELSPYLLRFCKKFSLLGNILSSIVFKPVIHIFIFIFRRWS